ncbi:MAG: RNA polymerase sigma factor [Planctomycetes bacterium]|nr:RNA polymerase sigma factor [Planctomycetota bacterium]
MVKEQNIRALIEAAQDGNREAFEKLVEREARRLRALAASRLSAHIVLEVDLEDVHQETLLRALKSIRSFEWRGEGSFFPWLGGIVEKVILELARKGARERKAPLDPDLPAEGVSPSRVLRREERLQRLEDCLEALSPEHRQVIHLTRIERLTFPEAAERMGRSPDAVKQLLYRALKQLKSTFGDTESFHLPTRGLKDGKGGGHGR